MNNLKHGVSITYKWFNVSSLKAIPRKLQFMILVNHQQSSVTVKVNYFDKKESNKVVLQPSKHVEDVFKTCLEDVLEIKCLLGYLY